MFSGDVLFQGSVGRTDLPGGDWDTLLRVNPHPGRHASGGHHRLSRAHGRHEPRRRAGVEPVPRRARAVSAGRLQAPRGTLDVMPADAQAAPAPAADRRRGARPGRLRALRDARVRGHRGVRPRRGRVDGHRPEGDVHLRGQGRPLAHAASREHRRRLPGLRRARHAQAAPAGEALDLGPVLPPRGAAGRALSPVHAGRRRGAGLRRSLARRRADPAAGRDPGPCAVPASSGCACRAWAARTPGPPIWTSCGPTCAPTRTGSPTRCASGSTRTRCAPSTPIIRARGP